MKPKDQQEQFVNNLINCQPALYAYILSLLPNRDEAGDVLQDVNLVMWRRSDEYAEGTNFIAWAYKIARFKVLARHRDRHRDRHIFDQRLFAALADQAERRASDPRGLASLLDDCLEELPANQRELIEERYSPGGSVGEMARRLGRSAAALSVALSRIRNSLLQCIHRKMSGGRWPR
ncbi:MAG: sigma-70 family RNA polymerase sigma factor [Pirellulales bacterium]|nr:sigma-70 family RNA polymerase sigma factor [Pirellulales bacterium]